VPPLRRTASFWSEQWQGTEERVRAVAGALRSEGAVVASGGDWDRWDLQVRGGLLGGARLRIGIEEHGSGKQLVRVRSWPTAGSAALVLVALLTALAVLAGVGNAAAAAILLAAFAVLALTRLLYECGHGEAAHGETREREAQHAARILGIEKLHFWHEPDGRLRVRRELVQRLAQLIDTAKCSLLYAPQPHDDHPDHRAAARLVKAAVGCSAAHPALRLFEIWSPLGDMDEIVDISAVIDEKRRAIRAYHSQCAVMRLDDAVCRACSLPRRDAQLARRPVRRGVRVRVRYDGRIPPRSCETSSGGSV
jgi:LmbE family N-acetylglucosaminyl deacetylase